MAERLVLRIDRTRCDGAGFCEVLAPDHLRVGDDGLVTLLRERVEGPEVEDLREAVRTCPTGALELTGHDPG